MRLKISLLAIVVFIAIALFITLYAAAPPEITPHRAVAITVDVEQETFSVDTSIMRDHESMCLVINQSDYWEAGDRVETAQPHPMSITIDENRIFYRGVDFFGFWRNANITTVYDEQGNEIGQLLTAPMYICVNTETIAPGEHTARAEIISTSGIIHAYSWNFTISEILRSEMPSDLIPTAEFLQRVDTTSEEFPCGGYRTCQTVCIVVSDTLPSPAETQFTIDSSEIALSELYTISTDRPGVLVCADTYRFTRGRHLASIEITDNDGGIYSYSWLFTIE
jgi:hypothetical protein